MIELITRSAWSGQRDIATRKLSNMATVVFFSADWHYWACAECLEVFLFDTFTVLSVLSCFIVLGVLIKENINEGHHTILDQVIMQGDSFDSTSGKGLLWAYFETSEGLKGIYVTPRLGANYFLVRNTLKWI